MESDRPDSVIYAKNDGFQFIRKIAYLEFHSNGENQLIMKGK